MDDSFIFTINCEEPIPMETFTSTLVAIQNQFYLLTGGNAQLLVKEIRKGSFEFEFISAILGGSLFNTLTNFNTIGQFFEYLKSTVNWLSNREKKPDEKKYTMKEIRDFKKIFSPISENRNQSSTIKMSNKNHDVIEVTHSDVLKIEQNIKMLTVLDQLEKDSFKETNFTKVLFYWYQTGFDSGKINTGNKGIISRIDNKPRKIIFENDASKTKIEMTTTNVSLGLDWQKVGYIVDVELIYKEENIVAYKILNNYMNDAIIEDDYLNFEEDEEKI